MWLRLSIESKMQTQETTSVLKCKNILISLRGLAEVDGKKVVLFVPAAEIDHVILKYGKAEHRPILALLMGVIFALVGVCGLVELILAPRGLRYELGMMFFGFIGGSIIYDALKKRHFLEVHKIKGNCRLVFSKTAPLKDIQDFCEKARVTYKYKITEDILTA
jgi:hypothetical protein